MFKKMTLEAFVAQTASGEPVPGGGSVAAMTGALAAALSAMVANLTVGKAKYAEFETEMTQIKGEMEAIKDVFLDLIDEDSAAFDGVMKAMKLPKETDAEKQARTAQMQASLKEAAEAPLKIAEKAAMLFDTIESLVKHGNANAQTDALVAAMLARTAILSALYNVKINLLSIKDESYAMALKKRVASLETIASSREQEILAISDL